MFPEKKLEGDEESRWGKDGNNSKRLVQCEYSPAELGTPDSESVSTSPNFPTAIAGPYVYRSMMRFGFIVGTLINPQINKMLHFT
jgi:hypothetical protein